MSNDMTNDSLQHLLNVQRKAHLADPYPSVKLRKDRIKRAIDMVVKHEKGLCDAVMADFGNRQPLVTQASDILPTVNELRHANKHVAQWMKTENRKSNFPLNLLGGKSKVEYIPMGVVGNISPWNFPISLALAPLADIFAAGNRMMLKPSELSAHTSELMAAIIKESFDEAELAVVLGGPDVAAQFSALKFDHLLFTGSTNVARLVASSAAKNLVPLTLELGGKNPVVVAQSADVKLAAEKIMWAKTLNGGQICLCPDTVYVHESLMAEFTEACQAAVKHMLPDIHSNEDYTYIITPNHASRLRDMVAEAETAGAEIIKLYEVEASNERCVPPTLIINPGQDTRLMQEEVFGGPLPVVGYSDMQAVVARINSRPHALALYYFGEKDSEIETLTFQTQSGGMVINDLLAHHLQDDLPFGGVGDSGMGTYHGFDGFKNFSHAKSIYKQSKLDPLKMVRPPFSQKLQAYVDKKIRG